MCVGGAYADVQGVSTDAKGACEHVGWPQSCVGDEAGGFEFGRRIAGSGEVENDFGHPVVPSRYLASGAAKSMRRVGTESSFATSQTGNRVSGSRDTQTQTNGFGVIGRIENRARVGGEGSKPGVVVVWVH